MGHTIALSAALVNIDVRMYGRNDEELELCKGNIDKRIETLRQNNFLKESEAIDVKQCITLTTSLEETAKEATFIIEAIVEDLSIKKRFIIQLKTFALVVL